MTHLNADHLYALNSNGDVSNGNQLSFHPLSSLDAPDTPCRVSVKSDICLYIHIPFCTGKCSFCSIETCQKFSKKTIDEYVNSLVAEIEGKADLLSNSSVLGLHFGGGTPSLLSIANLEQIFATLKKYIPSFRDTEVVFEANPTSINIDKVSVMASHSKLSLNIGIQTYNEEILSRINRKFDLQRFQNLMSAISKVDLHTLGVDLICNLPFSTHETTTNDIEMSVDLGINHFAIYPLRVEANTELHNNYDLLYDKIPFAPKQMEIFDIAKSSLLALGFDHYSIFHFTNKKIKSHVYSRRQIMGGEWIGLGAGASSYYRNQVFDNTNDIDEYTKAQKMGLSSYKNEKMLKIIDVITWEIGYSLRSRELYKSYYIGRYGRQIYESLLTFFRVLQKNGYAKEYDDRLELTTSGIFNLVSVELLLDEFFKGRSNKRLINRKDGVNNGNTQK